MVSRLEVLALALAALSLVATVAVTAMPQWRVSAHIGADLIVMQSVWEGLWMSCVRQLQVMDCKAYPSVLILGAELQAARGFMVASIVVAVMAFVVTACGSEVTSGRGGRAAAKTGALAAGGALFLLAGLCTLAPVCWVAHTIIQTFYSPVASNAQRRELGAALYTGWAAAAVTMATGALLLLRYGQRRRREEHEERREYERREHVTYSHKADSVYLQRAPSSSRTLMQYV